jgi:hypothetical protein
LIGFVLVSDHQFRVSPNAVFDLANQHRFARGGDFIGFNSTSGGADIGFYVCVSAVAVRPVAARGLRHPIHRQNGTVLQAVISPRRAGTTAGHWARLIVLRSLGISLTPPAGLVCEFALVAAVLSAN